MKKQLFLLALMFIGMLNLSSAQQDDNFKNRNVRAIGYQIGGFSFIGFEYEIRFHDYFGINFGGGFKGYTGGIKIHSGKKKNSPSRSLGFAF